jgi:RNase P/RNase MRP subunit p29
MVDLLDASCKGEEGVEGIVVEVVVEVVVVMKRKKQKGICKYMLHLQFAFLAPAAAVWMDLGHVFV